MNSNLLVDVSESAESPEPLVIETQTQSTPVTQNRWGRRASWVALGAYSLAILEMFFMVSPFAVYFYGIFSPFLQFLHSSPYLSWFSEFYVSHISTPDSIFLRGFQESAGILFLLGMLSFVIHAIHLYYMKFVKKGIAKRMLYAYVRHPQYLSLMVAGLGLVMEWPRFINLFLFFGMTVAYYALSRYEESRVETKHGESYRRYKSTKAMFFPGNPGGRLADFLFGQSRARVAGSFVLVFISFLIGSALLRVYSIRSLKVPLVSQNPKSLVVAMDIPQYSNSLLLAERTIRSIKPEGSGGKMPVLYLLNESHTLWHLLIDTGITHEFLRDVQIPEANLYILQASASYPCSSYRCLPMTNPRDALSPKALRSLDAVYYLPVHAQDFRLRKFTLPKEAIQSHASVPII